MLSVLTASDRSEEFFGNLAQGYQSRIKRLGPLLLAALLALLLKGGMIAKVAAVAKGAAAAKSAILAKGAAATKAAATGLAV